MVRLNMCSIFFLNSILENVGCALRLSHQISPPPSHPRCVVPDHCKDGYYRKPIAGAPCAWPCLAGGLEALRRHRPPCPAHITRPKGKVDLQTLRDALLEGLCPGGPLYTIRDARLLQGRARH